MLLSEGQMSDYKGAALMLDALPRAKAMLGDKGYDADWFRNALIKRGIVPCIPHPLHPLKSQSPTIRRFIASAIKSKICSVSSRTGGASTPAMIDARTPSSQQYASRLQSSSGSINES